VGERPDILAGDVPVIAKLVMAEKLKTFREACCERLGIFGEAFERDVLLQCIPPQHLLIGRLVWRFGRGYFRKDIELIREVANCTNLGELHTELSDHQYKNSNRGFWRGFLRLRLSGQRLVDLACKFLPAN
jgi:hypothetical protein